MPAATFFDCAPVHILTTATLAKLSAFYPGGRFEPRRFRPNILVATGADESSFVENTWVGRTIAVGAEVRIRITGNTGRCVMTTLAQDGLPAIWASSERRRNPTTATSACMERSSGPVWCASGTR